METRRTLRTLAVALGLLIAAVSLLQGCGQDTPTTWTAAPAQTRDMGPMFQGEDLRAHDRSGPRESALLALGTLAALAGLTCAAVSLALRYARRARVERGFDPAAPLVDGHAVVFGRVEDDGLGPAIQVKVHQRAREWRGRDGWHVTWNETSREHSARPFTLRLTRGDLLRVEPGEQPALDHELSRTEQYGREVRTLVAALLPGEEVHITGAWLRGMRGGPSGVYRETVPSPVLRPAPLERMVVSAERPGATAERLAGVHRHAAVVLLAALGGFFALTSTFWLLAVDGVRVHAAPLATGSWQQWVQPKGRAGYWIEHDVIRAQYALADGGVVTVEDACGIALSACVADGQCAEVPFLVARHGTHRCQVGSAPTLPTGRAFALFAAAVVLGLLYGIVGLGARPWYAKPRLSSTHRGRLSEA